MSDTLITKTKNQVAHITLNRPKAFNSFNREMALAFQDALKNAAEDDAIRAILITGNGKAFSAGQDLKEVTDEKNNPGFKTILQEHYNHIIRLIRNTKLPIIAAV